jgi:hypothetical protein
VDRIEVRATHPYRFAPDEARRRLLRLVRAIADEYPGYQLRHEWADGAETSIAFHFEKPGRGKGAGLARLLGESVEVELRAEVKLPFFVPLAMAEWRVRDELAKALRASFE